MSSGCQCGRTLHWHLHVRPPSRVELAPRGGVPHLRDVHMSEIRHYKDTDGYYNGSEGTWTICGLEWRVRPKPPGDIEDCGECLTLRQQRIDAAMADWRQPR